MTTARATAANPRVLQWARERAGFTQQQVAAKLKKPLNLVVAWEEGRDFPTFKQLEHLADALYKRPVAIFFFPDPPEETTVAKQFRTLPDSEIQKLHPDTLFAVREARAFRDSLAELADDRNPATLHITQALHGEPRRPVTELAADVRAFLGVDLSTQFAWRTAEAAFKAWRVRIESAGVFVLKRSFKQSNISGFCLHDATFPLIVVNNSTAHSRQVFTLFHELGHLLFGVGGITKESDTYIGRLPPDAQAIEVACNRFASEFLVPDESVDWLALQRGDLDRSVEAMAARYCVSREVILRKFLDRSLVTQRQYDERVAEYNAEYRRSRQSRSGGNYYATQATYHSAAFLKLAFGKYYSGRLTIEELADHIGMKARNIPRFADTVFSEA